MADVEEREEWVHSSTSRHRDGSGACMKRNWRRKLWGRRIHAKTRAIRARGWQIGYQGWGRKGHDREFEWLLCSLTYDNSSIVCRPLLPYVGRPSPLRCQCRRRRHSPPEFSVLISPLSPLSRCILPLHSENAKKSEIGKFQWGLLSAFPLETRLWVEDVLLWSGEGDLVKSFRCPPSSLRTTKDASRGWGGRSTKRERGSVEGMNGEEEYERLESFFFSDDQVWVFDFLSCNRFLALANTFSPLLFRLRNETVRRREFGGWP